jgi:hypothetical protein
MSTPGSRRRLPSAWRCHAPGLVPSPRFLTALTACSIRRSRVCCTPLPARGSPRFLTREASSRPKTALDHADIPRDAASYPSKNSPRRQPCRVTTAVALLSSPLVPRRATTPSSCLRGSTIETASPVHRPVLGGNRRVRASLGESNRSRHPFGLPCSTRSTLIPAPPTRLPEQSRPSTGSVSVASAARARSPPPGRFVGQAETRMHAIAATRWLSHSVDAIPSPSSQRRAAGVSHEPKLERCQLTEVSQLASSRPAEADWHLVRCLRDQRRALSMMVMLRSTEADPHVTTTTLRSGANQISGASLHDSDHRGGSTGVNRSSSASRLG